jgi:hypothetical protein
MAEASDSWFGFLVESIPNCQPSAFNSNVLKANLDRSDFLALLRGPKNVFRGKNQFAVRKSTTSEIEKSKADTNLSLREQDQLERKEVLSVVAFRRPVNELSHAKLHHMASHW